LHKFYCEPLFQLCSGIVTFLQNTCRAFSITIFLNCQDSPTNFARSGETSCKSPKIPAATSCSWRSCRPWRRRLRRRLPGSLLLQRLGVPLPPLLRGEPVVAPLGHGPPRLRPLPVALPLVAACSPQLRSRTKQQHHPKHTGATTENIKKGKKKNLAGPKERRKEKPLQ